MNSYLVQLRSYLADLLHAEFLHPWFFWLLIPVLFVCVLALIRAPKRFAVSLLRTITFALVIAALADPVKTLSRSEEKLTALFDISGSISTAGRTALLSLLKPFLDSGTSVQLVPFARLSTAPVTVDPQSSLTSLTNQSTAEGSADTGETNLQNAASSILTGSDSASVLLLSDGFETEGSVLDIADRARESGVHIFPLIPSHEAFSSERLSIASVLAPLTADSGAAAELRVSLQNGKATSQHGYLDIYLDDKKLFSEFVTVPENQQKLVTVKTPELTGGLKRIRAVLRDGATSNAAQSDERDRWISVKEKAKIVLLSGSADDARVLDKLFNQLGYAVDSHIAPNQAEIKSDFTNTSLVILNNVAKSKLPDGYLSALEAFVRKGGGLLMVGGDESYGLGGYIDTPLEKISPVKFVPPETKKRRLNNAVVLVVDKSRSMVFQDKILAAKKAALSSIYSLKDDDYVGVIGFDSTPFVIIRLAPVSEVKPQAESRLRNLTAAGRTDLLPALALARNALKEVNVGRRHIIILTDGKLPMAGNAYFDEIAKLRELGVSVSTVGLGIEADVPFLRLLAQYGKGAFYEVPDPNDLPDIFIKDIKVATGEQTLKEKEDYTVRVGSDGLASTTVSLFPEIEGFVKTLPKKGSRLELVTQDAQAAYPVLASWPVDKGKVIAFTSDANGRWSKRWLPWQGFPVFWREVVQSLQTQSPEKDIDFDLRYSVQNKAISFDLAIYDDTLSAHGAPQISGQISAPDGTKKTIVFTAQTKGRFQSVVSDARPGDYHLDITYGLTKLPPLAMTIPADIFSEKQGKGINVGLLTELAHRTDGLVNPLPTQVAKKTRVTEDRKHLFGPLVVAAFFLVILEAFIRELFLSSVVLASTGRPRRRNRGNPTAKIFDRDFFKRRDKRRAIV